MNANIPGFSDAQAQSQNSWIKLADYNCVDYYPGETARTYQAEHAAKYHNQEDTSYYEFSFESSRQSSAPPYDIKTGDYIGFKQGTSIFWYRIVKMTATAVLSGCCVIQIVANITQPREAQYLLDCGFTEALSDEEVNGGLIGEARDKELGDE